LPSEAPLAAKKFPLAIGSSTGIVPRFSGAVESDGGDCDDCSLMLLFFIVANAEMKRDTTRRNEVLKRDTFPLFIVHKYAHGYGVWFVYGKTMKKLHPSFKTRT
jgi:hypothetical protein